MIFLIGLVIAAAAGFIGLVIYTFYHAYKHGEERRLEYFLLGECWPEPVTKEELGEWLRGV